MFAESHLDFHAYLRDAAILRLRLEAWTRDQKFRIEGGTIIYAVDNDIVKLFANPIDTSKYAQVFHDDESRGTQALASMLARFIFYDLTGKQPLLIIPPHDLELLKICNAIERKMPSEQNELNQEISDIGKLISVYNKTLDIDVLAKGLMDQCPKFLPFIVGEGTGMTAQLARITKLIREERLLHVERFVVRVGDKSLALPVPDESSQEDYTALLNLKHEWFTRLRTVKHHKLVSDERVDDDAEVLARLQWINRELNSNRQNVRLLLISGDQALHRVTDNYQSEGNLSFADLYIRHPISFLDASQLSYEEQLRAIHERWKFSSSFDLILERFRYGDKDYYKTIKTFLYGPDDADSKNILSTMFTSEKMDGFERLRRNWQDFIQFAFAKAVTSSNDLALQSAKDLMRSPDSPSVRIDERITKTLIDFFGASAQSGFWSLPEWHLWSRASVVSASGAVMDTSETIPARAVPPLRFENFDLARRYGNEIISTLNHSKLMNNPVSVDELISEDPSRYTYYLVYGLAFATASRWHATRILAQRAVSIADELSHKIDSQVKTGIITGNEAAYLLAVAIRHNGKSKKELEEARSWLDDAKLRMEKCGKQTRDIRFEDESVAIDITWQQYRMFLKWQPPQNVASLSDCQKKLLELLRILGDDKNEEDVVRTVIERHILNNIFTILFLRKYKEGHEAPERDIDIDGLLRRFESIVINKQSGGKFYPTPCLIRVIYLLAEWQYGPLSEHDRIIRLLKKLIEPSHVGNFYVMQYDPIRYQFFLDIVEGKVQ